MSERRTALDFLRRLVLLLLGLAVFSVGITMTLNSGLGLSPWDVLHQGLSLHTPLTFGWAIIVVGVAIVLLNLLLRIRPGLATLLNMTLVGVFIDLLLAYRVLPDVRNGPLLQRLLLDLGGIAVTGLGSGLYIKAALGAGPRDSLMLALSRITGRRVGVVRTLIEASALGIGFLLGGTVGIGTLLFSLGIGPAVDLSFRILGVPSPHRRRAQPEGEPF